MMNKLLCGRRILVIEDETMISMMIESMLADLGCESVTAAATVNKALSLIDGHVFDCAMLDMNMSGNTSHSVAEALVARGVPFIYCTGNNSQKVKNVLHPRAVLKKPFGDEELAKAVTGLLNL
jgi:CheY-like chemotaxis protein